MNTTTTTTATATTATTSTSGRTTTRLCGALLAAAAVAGSVAGPASAHEITGPLNGETRAALAQVRAATAGYHDVDAALADGFVPASPCVSNPAGEGAMGVHYVDMDRLATGFELTRPEVLIYEPEKNGGMRLVGVEYIVFPDQDPATDDRPVFPGGIGFHAPHDAPAHLLHAYIWKHNPEGMFVDYNPRNSCR